MMIASVPAVLWQHPWVGIALMATAFAVLIAALKCYAVHASPNPETLRKLLHLGSGLLTLAFPFLFADVWPVLLLTGSTAMFLGGVKFLPPIRSRFGAIVRAGGRTTFGELYFPAAVALVFWWSHGEALLMFVIPVLVLSVADAAGAVIGIRYGTNPYGSSNKTVEGSVAFAVVAYICIRLPLMAWGSTGRMEAVLIAATLALAVTLLEGVAWRGLDNLFIPIGAFFILGALLELDFRALQLWLIIALAVVGLIVIRIESTHQAVHRRRDRKAHGAWPVGRPDVRRKGSLA